MKVPTTLLFLLSIILTLGVGCANDSTPTVDDQTDEAQTTEPFATVEVDVFPRETITPPANETDPLQPESVQPAEDSYPLPDEPPSPTNPTVLIDGYPVPMPVTPIATPVNAYPIAGEPIWMIRPFGIQCEPESISHLDLFGAVSALTAAGVPVSKSEVVELTVTEGCGNPMSPHFRVEIDNLQVETAVSLGWTADE